MQVDIEPRIKEYKAEYKDMYNSYRTYLRTTDSLNFLKKINWLQQQRGLDTIWTLGRTYEAITAHYKSGIVKALNNAKNTSDTDKNLFAYIDAGSYYTIPFLFTIDNVYSYLPKGRETVVHDGEIYRTAKAWFTANGRLCAIKYLNTTKHKGRFGQPLENAWYYSPANRYITASNFMMEYFGNDTESGLLLTYPYSKMESTDPDGRKWQSISSKLSHPTQLLNRWYFKAVYKYLPGLGFDGEDAKGNMTGALVTAVTPGKSLDVAGLKKGDVINRIGYSGIYSINDAVNILLLYSPGEVVEIEYYRGASSHIIKVKMGNLSDESFL